MRTEELDRLRDALDRFLEADLRRRKLRAVTPIERALEANLQRAWRRQSTVFLLKLTKLAARFTAAETSKARLLEAIREDEWLPLFDQAALETLELFVGPISMQTEKALLAGAKGTIADLALDTSFELGNPRALTELRATAAARVAGINATTRDDIRAIIADGVAQRHSYSAIARDIKAKYSRFAVGSPLEHIASRAELVAVTEIGDAYEKGSRAVVDRLTAAGLEMEKQWLDVGDRRVDPVCVGNSSEGWIPVGQAFASGHDLPTAHPGCLPGAVRVSAREISAATKRWYEGDLVVIRTAGGKDLAATPNHPILTPTGWVAAGLLDVGGHVIGRLARDGVAPGLDLDDEYVPASIEEVAEAFGRSEQVTAVPVPLAAEDFHGDGAGSEVAVVWTDRLLHDGLDASLGQQIREQSLVGRHVARLGLSRPGHLRALLGRMLTATRSFVGVSDLRVALLGAHVGPFQTLGLRSPSGRLAVLAEYPSDGVASDPVPTRETLERLAGAVGPEKIVEVRRGPFRGHVYNLETGPGWYLAEGIVTHNCRCTTEYRRRPREG